MEELTLLYSPSQWVDGKSGDEVMNEFFAGITKSKEQLISSGIPRELDISYGNSERHAIDVWGDVKDKMVVFFHGGYWQEGTRKDCLPPVNLCLEHGYAFASVGYPLATEDHPLSDTVTCATKGVCRLLDEYPKVSTVILAGHSAGAHLAFSAARYIGNLDDPHYKRISGLLLFAGVYQLEELVKTDIGKGISLTTEEARKTRCDYHDLDNLPLRTLVILGLQDSPKLVEQNRKLAEHGKNISIEEFPSLGHFTIITKLDEDCPDLKKPIAQFLESF